jgi:hypothetical protein
MLFLFFAIIIVGGNLFTGLVGKVEKNTEKGNIK